jgi:hypothetical protein
VNSPQRVEEPHQYLDRGFEYYVAGRFCAINRFVIAANLLHHAVELFIKFGILRYLPRQEAQDEARRLSRRPYSHDLSTLWDRFNALVPAHGLEKFDDVISELNRWESLRYGGFPTGRPLALSLLLLRPDNEAEPWVDDTSTDADSFQLVLEDIDELVSAILEASQVNPPFLGVRHQFRTPVKDYYLENNRHATVWPLTEPS